MVSFSGSVLNHDVLSTHQRHPPHFSCYPVISRGNLRGARCFTSCALQDVRQVLKEHAKGASPGLTEGPPILIDDDAGDKQELAEDKLR